MKLVDETFQRGSGFATTPNIYPILLYMYIYYYKEDLVAIARQRFPWGTEKRVEVSATFFPTTVFTKAISFIKKL